VFLSPCFLVFSLAGAEISALPYRLYTRQLRICRAVPQQRVLYHPRRLASQIAPCQANVPPAAGPLSVTCPPTRQSVVTNRTASLGNRPAKLTRGPPMRRCPYQLLTPWRHKVSTRRAGVAHAGANSSAPISFIPRDDSDCRQESRDSENRTTSGTSEHAVGTLPYYLHTPFRREHSEESIGC